MDLSKLTRRLFFAVLVALLTQACAFAAVSVSWTDAAGVHAVNLSLIPNVDYQGEWDNVELPGCWYGELNVTMADTQPIVFTGSGNFMGSVNASYGLYDMIRIKQNVLNHTNKNWTSMHIDITGGGFYKVWQLGSGWSYDQQDPTVDLTKGVDGQPIHVNETLLDGFGAYVDTDYYFGGSGDGAFTFTKQVAGTAVPEPGSMVMALLGGATGLLSYVKRRKV